MSDCQAHVQRLKRQVCELTDERDALLSVIKTATQSWDGLQRAMVESETRRADRAVSDRDEARKQVVQLKLENQKLRNQIKRAR